MCVSVCLRVCGIKNAYNRLSSFLCSFKGERSFPVWLTDWWAERGRGGGGAILVILCSVCSFANLSDRSSLCDCFDD